jgi:AcrR family transcriptional regulator
MSPTKQRRAPAQRPGEILDAALALFVEKGFAATRLDDVAVRAGLSKAAIYLYFEDKTALFQGVVRQAVVANLGTVEAMLKAHRGPVASLLPRILEFMAGRIEETPLAAVAKVVISESRAFPEIGRFYLKEVIGRGLPLLEGLIRRGIAQGEFRRVDPAMTVRSIVGPMLLAGIWRTVFEPIGAEKLDVRALARHHADLMLHALAIKPGMKAGTS